MVRKIVVMLLTGAICLIGASSLLAAQSEIYGTIQEYEKLTGKKIKSFSEAPMLREKVATGELPSVEQRVPEEPLVVQPADKIGKYGGTLRTVTYSWNQFGDMLWDHPLVYSSDMKEIKPNIFKSWEISKDGRTFIFHLRKGMKWSDGYPFTADDFMFWYEDVALNKELNPAGVYNLKVGGEMGVMKKIDDYTIQLSFAGPYGVLLERLCRWRPKPYLPKHYLKQFHPNYTPKDELDKIVKKEGFDSWVSLFESRIVSDNPYPGVPTIDAWLPLDKFGEAVQRYIRNPYYWKIDTAGNQLPYIDRLEEGQVGDSEGVLMKALAGDIDLMNSYTLGYASNYPVLKKNEKKGNYRLVSQYGWCDNIGDVVFNYSHKDPVLRKIFADKRFRIALSVAMNRDEINKVIFKGMYKPSQPAPPDGPPYHGELPQFHVYTQYDPQLANHLLDLMGLKWDKDHNVRLRSDGKPLQLVASVQTGWIQHVPMAEMYKKYWKEVGIGITLKPLSEQFYSERRNANQHEIGIEPDNFGGRRPIIAAMRDEPVPITPNWMINSLWARWLLTKGEKGEEPPEDVKRLFEINKEFMAEPDAEKRIALEKEIYLIHCENLWEIGGIKQPANLPQVWYEYFSNRVKNVPDPCPPEDYYIQPSTWSIEE